MKTLFFTAASIHNSILASQLEILEGLIKQGKDIDVIMCNSSIDACWWMKLGKNLEGCITCQSKFVKAFDQHEQVFKGLNYIYLENNKSELPKINLEKYNSVSDLLNYTYKDCKIGVCVVSSIVSLFRDKDFNIRKNEDLIIKHLHTAMFIYDFLEDYIKVNNPKDIYFFNGRFSETYPIQHLCEINEINYFSYELTNQNEYILVENTVVHNYLNHIKQIDLLWEQQGNNKEGIEKAKFWFEKSRSGVFYQATSTDLVFQNLDYVREQQKGLLPNGFDFSKKNITLFISSVDEIYAIYPELCEQFDQIRAIEFLAEYFTDMEDYVFYVRVHPNLKGVNSKWVTDLLNISYKNVVIIPAKSKIDSYDLLINSEKVVSFGSTIGVEATYWGKPSILYGEISFYNPKDIVYKVKELKKLVLLIEKNITPKERESTFAYGYSRNMFGKKIKSFNNLSSVSFEDISQWKNTMDKKGYLLIHSYFLLRKYKFPMSFIPFKDTIERKIIQSYAREKI